MYTILLAVPVSIGCFVFLIQQTDFIYEYLSFFSKIFKLNFVDFIFKFDYYEKNSSKFENYISFVGSIFGTQKNLVGFVSRLLSCFICLNCFLSLIFIALIYNMYAYFLPCFFISTVTYFCLFSIKRSIYK